MSNKKNQHYVPQFYLRKFSSESDKVINLYNLDSKKFIKNATIKHQASENYFYGKNIEIENALAYFEEGIVDIFNKILKEHRLPSKNSAYYELLLIFISIQYNRTKFAHDDMMNAHKQMMSIIGKEFSKFSTLSESSWIYEKMTLALYCVKFLKDLKMKLLINNTSQEFICSDNPVVFYNQFLESKGRSEIGYDSIGIEIFLPISPSLSLILYDKKIYHIGEAMSNIVEILQNDDVSNLNLLQLLSANDNVYFSNNNTQEYIRKILEQGVGLRKNSMSTVTEYYSVTNKYESLLKLHLIPIVCNLKLSFVKLTKKAKRYRYDPFKVIHTRHIKQ